MKYIEWIEQKIYFTEKLLFKLEPRTDEENYTLHDVIKNMLKVYKTCKKKYEELGP